MPSDGYANPEGKSEQKLVNNSEIANIVKDENRKIIPLSL